MLTILLFIVLICLMGLLFIIFNQNSKLKIDLEKLKYISNSLDEYKKKEIILNDYIIKATSLESSLTASKEQIKQLTQERVEDIKKEQEIRENLLKESEKHYNELLLKEKEYFEKEIENQQKLLLEAKESYNLLKKEKEEERLKLEYNLKELQATNAEQSRLIAALNEKISAQIKLENDLNALLENAKQEITNQNKIQYSAIKEQLQKFTEEKGKELNKEATEKFENILAKDVKDVIVKITENLNLQQEKLTTFQEPVNFLKNILASSKESGSHGEQTIINQLEGLGFRYNIDYFTQISGKLGEEKLIADVVILVPNSGAKDVLIIDSKSSTKLGAGTKEFSESVKNSANVFARKDYKNAIEKRLKEDFNIIINQTHLFLYLPFDRMLSRISEEEPELLKTIKSKEIGILTPVILDFLLDSIKLYSAKIEINNNYENIMSDVKTLIERTGKVIEFIKDLGKSINQVSNKYKTLNSSVSTRFIPSVNKMAKPLNIKTINYKENDEEELKEIEGVTETLI